MKAYSLLELSIVVVIMALLMAGISSGQAILKKAKLHGAITELKEIEASIILFKEQYSYYPGDFNNAYYYFGEDKICGTESECNGDGDDIIEIGSKNNSEVYRSFQHLNLAGLIKQQFNGVWGESHSVMQASTGGNYTIIYDYQLENIIKLGKEISISGETSDGGILLPKDAEIIDKKIDDGFPNKGDVRGMMGFYGGSSTNLENYNKNCLSESMYNVTFEDNKACAIGLKI